MPGPDADTLVRTLGLCARCLHRRTQHTRRGAVFYRCALADEDARFLRYPPIPVSVCPGHAAPAEIGTLADTDT